MTWVIIIVLFICLLLGFLFFSLIVVEVDTRIAKAEVRWKGIGTVKIWYEDDWWLSMKVPFYRKTLRFTDIKKGSKKTKDSSGKRGNKWPKIMRMLKKTTRVIKTFKLIEWQLAIDTGDYCTNAQLYSMNFVTRKFGHLDINFRGENFLVLKVNNRPWKILYAFLR
ncbi:MAG: hypothetical protein ACHQFX_10880 [Chitinophagales bacterium]